MTTTQPITEERYQKNLKFWEDAWSRVKQASTKIPDVLDYIPEIPESFQEHGCTKILDIACGSGWLSFYLNEFGFDVTGVDISPTGIKLANDLLAERKEIARANGVEKLFDAGKPAVEIDLSALRFQVADMFAMDFPENHFDGILVNAAFEHLDLDRGVQFMADIKQIIKPGGIMFAVFDKVASGKKGEFELLEDGTHQYIDEYRDGMFLRNYSDEELNKLFQDHNWQVVSQRKNKFESRITVLKNMK